MLSGYKGNSQNVKECDIFVELAGSLKLYFRDVNCPIYFDGMISLKLNENQMSNLTVSLLIILAETAG